MLTRRSFLHGCSLVAAAPSIPAFLPESLCAEESEVQSDGRILIVIQLDGGNDGLNTIVPYADDAYAKHRTHLKLPVDQVIKLDAHSALHPSLKSAAELLDDGRLTIVQGVGYPNPNRSHFRSMAIWQSGRMETKERDDFGWLGRAFDSSKNRGPNAVFVGAEKLPLALRGRRSSVVAMPPGESVTLATSVSPLEVLDDSQAPIAKGDDLRAFVRRNVVESYARADALAKDLAARRSTRAATYSQSKLAAKLQLIAQLIKSGSPARAFYAAQSGYDTHAGQLRIHASLLREFGDALKALLDDLAASGLADRVLVLAFSEFGRRVRENGSLGTDHGTAGPVFVAGPCVQAGLLGDAANLNDLIDGDLKQQHDFRQVYATLLEDWLRIDPRPVLGGEFDKPPLLAST